MERKIKLAGKEYEIKPNFKLSYALTKFRNKLSYGIDFDDADKEIIEEIAKVQLSAANGQDVDMTTLSPKTLKYLTKKSNQKEKTCSRRLQVLFLLFDYSLTSLK